MRWFLRERIPSGFCVSAVSRLEVESLATLKICPIVHWVDKHTTQLSLFDEFDTQILLILASFHIVAQASPRGRHARWPGRGP